MTDADGDNVYSITVSVPDGYTGDYTFVNGPTTGGPRKTSQVKTALCLLTTTVV